MVVVELFEAGELVSAAEATSPFSIETGFDRVFAFNSLSGSVSEIPVIRGGAPLPPTAGSGPGAYVVLVVKLPLQAIARAAGFANESPALAFPKWRSPRARSDAAAAPAGQEPARCSQNARRQPAAEPRCSRCANP